MKRRREEEDEENGGKANQTSGARKSAEKPEQVVVKAEVKAEEASDDEEDDNFRAARFRSGSSVRKGAECPYLDTISRQNLDFDFEKCCSVSLSPVNVYACLVCGKYFQ
eukprot:scaffold423894_cov21-Prasinocladus_malaysianus.AAC.2